MSLALTAIFYFLLGAMTVGAMLGVALAYCRGRTDLLASFIGGLIRSLPQRGLFALRVRQRNGAGYATLNVEDLAEAIELEIKENPLPDDDGGPPGGLHAP